MQAATPSLAVILLNYRRPQNIGPIARAAREALPEAPILILDQADDDSLRHRQDVPWNEVWLSRARENLGAGARVPLTARLPFDLYVAIDDDCFLTPAQIRRLAEAASAEPDRAHGVWGERLEMHQDGAQLRPGMTRMNAAVSNLNRVYAFSRAQAAAAIALSAEVGFDAWREVRVGNDIFLSCASAKAPLCHDLGEIDYCPTSDAPGIAVWRSEGFMERRLDIYRRLVAAKGIALFSPLTVIGPPSGDGGPI